VVKGLLVTLVLQTLAFSNTKRVVWISNAPAEVADKLPIEGNVFRDARFLVICSQGGRLYHQTLEGLHANGRFRLILELS